MLIIDLESDVAADDTRVGDGDENGAVALEGKGGEESNKCANKRERVRKGRRREVSPALREGVADLHQRMRRVLSSGLTPA